MRFLVSAEDHQLRYIQAEKGCNASDKSAPQPQVTTIFTSDSTTTIQCFTYTTFPSPTRGDVDAVALACSDGVIRILDAETGDNLATIPATATNTNQERGRAKQESKFVSIHACHGYIATCTAGGLARFTKVSSLWSDAQITYESALPGPISVLRIHPRELGVIAFAGQENEVNIWCSEKEDGTDRHFQALKPFWSARNVKNDKLDLRVPVWISDLHFFEPKTQKGYGVVISTRYRQLRLYETEKARRPLSSIELAKHPIAQMELDKDAGKTGDVVVVFTDTQGNVSHANVSTGQIIGSYKGFSGAVGSITVSTEPGCMAAGGMDSYLRVFHTSGHQELLNVYIGARITNVLVLPEDAEVKEEVMSDDESEDEDIWNELSEVDPEENKGAIDNMRADEEPKADSEEDPSRHKRARRV